MKNCFLFMMIISSISQVYAQKSRAPKTCIVNDSNEYRITPRLKSKYYLSVKDKVDSFELKLCDDVQCLDLTSVITTRKEIKRLKEVDFKNNDDLLFMGLSKGVFGTVFTAGGVTVLFTGTGLFFTATGAELLAQARWDLSEYDYKKDVRSILDSINDYQKCNLKRVDMDEVSFLSFASYLAFYTDSYDLFERIPRLHSLESMINYAQVKYISLEHSVIVDEMKNTLKIHGEYK